MIKSIEDRTSETKTPEIGKPEIGNYFIDLKLSTKHE